MNQTKYSWSRLITGIIFFSFLIWLGFFTQKITREREIDTAVSNDNASVTQPSLPSNSTKSTPSSSAIENNPASTKPALLPKNVNLTVPFTSQAPFAVWDPLHEDACEEASLLMIKHFKNGTLIIDKQTVDNEIIDLINWEKETGYGVSITLEDLSVIARIKFNLTSSVKTASIATIKSELVAGHPVIVGAAGKILPNPNFRNGGPNYHMLVIKGYTTTKFITNDPGTIKGEGFEYTFDALYNSIHNWDQNNILNGVKDYLVFD
ncbi:MAG TPA: C39 family peptidase [Patescibacteria group bacterium]|nr:C39 family peptidase [Patescibacteria group bacterium]